MQAHDAFLRALGLCFLIAFLSFAAQSPGLYGEDGLEPVSAFLRRSAPNAKLHTAADMAAQFKELPTLLWFRGLVGSWSAGLHTAAQPPHALSSPRSRPTRALAPHRPLRRRDDGRHRMSRGRLRRHVRCGRGLRAPGWSVLDLAAVVGLRRPNLPLVSVGYAASGDGYGAALRLSLPALHC